MLSLWSKERYLKNSFPNQIWKKICLDPGFPKPIQSGNLPSSHPRLQHRLILLHTFFFIRDTVKFRLCLSLRILWNWVYSCPLFVPYFLTNFICCIPYMYILFNHENTYHLMLYKFPAPEYKHYVPYIQSIKLSLIFSGRHMSCPLFFWEKLICPL